MKTYVSFRANHLPAKYITAGEIVANKANRGYLRSDLKTSRRLIGDLCDFCLKNIKVRRRFITLRAKGFKFCCNQCRNKQIDGKTELEKKLFYSSKVIFEFIHPDK